MNIFVLSKDPCEAAKMQCDKHVVKMILESTQLLSTALWLNNEHGPYKPTHVRHPCTLWTAKSLSNWLWLHTHAQALSKEYTFRYAKIHACDKIISNMTKPTTINDLGLTPWAQAMPKQYKNDDVVKAYRTYYIKDKVHLAAWRRNRPPPIWWSTVDN